MRKVIIVGTMLLGSIIALPAIGQEVTIPQSEFALSLTDSLTLEKGSFEKFPVWVLRSRSMTGRKVKLRVASSLPEGIQVNFMTNQSYFDVCETLISASVETKPGVYHIIISGSATAKEKGRIIRLNVVEPTGSALRAKR